MVPANFIFLKSFPLTANGKIDRGALPQPPDMAPETETSIGPRTPTEEKLYQIWADILDIKHFGVNDNFFDLGGHSLLATRLLVHIRSEIGVGLPLRTLFDLPTIAELSKQLENLLWISRQKSQGLDGETDLQEEISI
jgi:acyl carrier protein